MASLEFAPGWAAAPEELSKLPQFVIGSAESVAEEGFDACMKGEVIRVPGVLNQATVLSARASPRWLLRRGSGAIVRGMK